MESVYSFDVVYVPFLPGISKGVDVEWPTEINYFASVVLKSPATAVIIKEIEPLQPLTLFGIICGCHGADEEHPPSCC